MADDFINPNECSKIHDFALQEDDGSEVPVNPEQPKGPIKPRKLRRVIHHKRSVNFGDKNGH